MPTGRVHPEVIQVMAELGVDLSSRTPRRLTQELVETVRAIRDQIAARVEQLVSELDRATAGAGGNG